MSVYVIVMFSILQSQFIKKGFKKPNFEQSVLLLLCLFTLDSIVKIKWKYWTVFFVF